MESGSFASLGNIPFQFSSTFSGLSGWTASIDNGAKGILFGFKNTGTVPAIGTIDISPLAILPDGGNLLVGTLTDNGSRLQVAGPATFSSSVTADGTVGSYNTRGGVGRLQIRGSQVGARSYEISNGIDGISNSGLQILDETAATKLLYFQASGAATFSSSVTATTLKASSQGDANALLLADIVDASWRFNTTGYRLNIQNDNGGTFVNKLSISNSGAATFASSVTATNAVFNTANNTVGLTVNHSGSNGITGVKFNSAGSGTTYGASTFSVDASNFGTGIRIQTNLWSNSTTAMSFYYQATTFVGSINCSSTATSYNTSSDYRLKENVIKMDSSILRLKKLNPCRFNFIIEPSRVVDGFLAHEVQIVIPEAVTGEKDKVRPDGVLEYQAIDQSKIVPLLTSALQEAISEIEKLQTRLLILENK